MRLRYKIVILLVPVALVNGCLIEWAFDYEPVDAGTSAEFWYYACGVELAAFEGRARGTVGGRILPETDGWFIYYRQRHHDRPLYRVGPNDVVKDLPQVLAALKISRNPDFPEDLATDCTVRLAEDEVGEAHVSELIAALIDGRRETFKSTDPKRHARLERDYEQFDSRWRRGKRAWLSFLFEGLFLTAWILFIAWPWLRKSDLRRKAIHLGFAPLALHVPFYLGYAPMTFTFGPSGGFLYPLLLQVATLGTLFLTPTIIDYWILSIVPRILAPLSQLPGPPTAATFYSGGAPFLLAMFGLAVVSLAAVGPTLRRRRLKLVSLWLLAGAAIAVALWILQVGFVWPMASAGTTVPEVLSGWRTALAATAPYAIAIVLFSFIPYATVLTVWASLAAKTSGLDRSLRSVVLGSAVLALPAILTIAHYWSEEGSDGSAPKILALTTTSLAALLLPRILLKPLRPGAFTPRDLGLGRDSVTGQASP